MLENYWTVFLSLLPIYLFIALGYFLRRVGWLSVQAEESLLNLQIKVFYPALIFSTLYGNEAFQASALLAIAPVTGFIIVVIGFGVSFIIAKVIRLEKGSGLRTFTFTTGIFNYGFIAIPLTIAVFGSDSITALLLVFNTGVEFGIWTFGVILLAGAIKSDAWKHLFNPPIIALMISLGLHFTVPPESIPEGAFTDVSQSVLSVVSTLGKSAIPLALIIIGASIRELTAKTEISWNLKAIIGGCFTRILLLPSLILCIGGFIPFHEDLKSVLIIQAAMPCGMFPIVMAKKYGGVPEIAVQVVISTTLVAMITTPMWIIVGRHFLQI